MPDTSYYLDNREPVAGSCAIPLPKGDNNITRSAMRYAQAFAQSLGEKQFVVLCKVPIPLAQAVTLGAWLAGHPVAFINPGYTKTQLNGVLSKLGTCLKIGRPDCLEMLGNQSGWHTNLEETGDNNLFDRLQPPALEETIVPYEWKDDECAAVIFTSGSTGTPKGVCHSIGNLTRSAQLFIQQFALDSHIRLLNLAPSYSMSGVRVSIIVPLLAGCQLIDCPKEPQLEDVLNIFYSERPTVCVCGPIFIRQIAMLADKLGDELSSIRVLLSAGTKLDRRSRIKIWKKHDIAVLDYYGLTETTGLVIAENLNHYNPESNSIGKACSGVTVDLTGVEGISDPAGETGQLRIYSPNLFLGYLGGPLARKRYFDTGDLGIRDAAGNIILKGRLGHGVKASTGFWLFPQAVEQLLVNRSDISDARVSSGYDQYHRGILRSQVVPANPETADEGWLTTLKQDIEGQLGPDYKAVDIEIASVIARTALGKTIKDSC
jgi:acyl-coenzyme A synthetase/AMP-(fatty) acid ligase